MLKASGIHVTTVTPFKESFELDLEGVKENIGFLLETEISSVVPLGTVGEFASLTTEERKRVTERVVDAVNGKRVPGVAGAEEISYFGLLAGCPGATSAMANFAPNLVVDMYRAIKKNDIPTASSIFVEKILLFRHLDVAAVLQGFPIQIVYVKEVMNLLGMHGGSVRPPLTQLTHEKMEELKRV